MTPKPSIKLYGTTAGFYSNAVDTIPKSNAGTGTITAITTSREIIGAGTLFLTELAINDVIFHAASFQLLKVVAILDNTHCTVEENPSAGIAGLGFKITRPMFARVEVHNIGAASGKILNEKLIEGQILNFPDVTTPGKPNNVPVIFYDATGTELAFITI